MIKILFLEDDEIYRDTIMDFLEDEGYDVDFCENGQAFLDKIYKKKYDIYIIDINVPFVNGYQILQMLKDYNDSTPSLVLTSIPNSAIDSFKVGCSGYLNKWDAHNELLLRIEALIKSKYRTYSNKALIDDNFSYDIFDKKLYFQDEHLGLTNIQTRILECFLQNKNQIVSIENIEKFVYPAQSDDKKDVLRYHISKLRTIFKYQYIFSHKKRGYSFVNSQIINT